MNSSRRDQHNPTSNEKRQKIYQAIEAMESGEIIIVADRHNHDAMDFLGADDMDEVLDWVPVFLQEIKAAGPDKCFAGQCAQKCYHPGFQDIFLFPYHWDSPSLNKRVYLKFGIRTVTEPDGKKFTYCHLDCHEDRPHEDKP